ncbi:MAG: HEAT repeat domain-containing protein, partial [Ruminiclostridium sp.]|nr:HEAT repeat domain-containing protein [Ruminiclostridium sp.]
MLFNHSIPGKKDLLKEFDSLGYSARVKKMAMLGRDNAQSKQYLDLLTSLLQDGTYEGHLALIGALTIKNSNIILSALKHPMASVRKTAAGFLADLASDDDIVQEIENLSQDCR